MITVVHPLQFCHRVVVGHRPVAVHPLAQPLDVGLQLCEEFLLGDAADSFVLWVEGEDVQVVQLAEHRELRELRDAGQEYEAEILCLSFQRTEQVADSIANLVLQLGLGDGVEHRGIVFVYQHHHFVARLLIGGPDDVRESGIIIVRVIDADMPFLFFPLEDIVDGAMQALQLIILAIRQVEPDDGILYPLLLQLLDGQTLEEFPAALEIALQRAHQERLAEPPGAAQEEVLRIRLRHLVDIRRFVHIQGSPFDEVGKPL